ncbi:MAG TPA: type II secretion system F family protein [Gemmatimonadaceae bacterium]|nr:type II secretion system F family protein [Gemmatimonadaceae bacterium]HRQ77315.1 type II secretion system F family protein [Gemmatimonadaceae bacterium]
MSAASSTSLLALLRSFDDGRDRAEFYRGWRMGLTAGLSHPMILSKSLARGGMAGRIREYLLAGTTRGEGIATLVRRAPQLFEPFEAALLAMGEESGQLDAMLTQLADFHTRQYKLILAVRKWMSYPMFVSLFAVVALPLPLVFQGKVGAYWMAAGGGLLLWFFAGGAVFAGLAQRYQRRPLFVRARFARTLSLCIGAGLTLPRALLLAADASGDPALARQLRQLGERRLASQPASVSLQGASVMTPELTGALLVAERTGDFAGPVGRLAVLYEDGFK